MNVKEFERNLHCGLGRCVTFLNNATSRNDYLQSVFYACTHNTCYDTQSEGTRAQYCYELARAYNADNYFTNGIIRRLGELNKEDDWEYCHLVDLLALFASGGCAEALKAMKREYARLFVAVTTTEADGYDYYRDEYERTCINMIKADRGEAVKVAQDVGGLVLCGLYEYSDFEGLYYHYISECKDAIIELLTLSITDEAIAKFIGGLNYDSARIDAARNNGIFKVRRNLPKENKLTPLKEFLVENANNEAALRTKLAQIDFSGEAWHTDVMDIIACSNELQLPDFVLEFVYENSPCSCCRFKCVKAMHERGALSREIIEECRHDSNLSVREFVEAL